MLVAELSTSPKISTKEALHTACQAAWAPIVPSWPLDQLIATNPLQGFESLPFAKAVNTAYKYVTLASHFPEMSAVNRITIKWCQLAFDEGQATIALPHREKGLYRAWRALAPYDRDLRSADWLKQLPECPEAALLQCLDRLEIEPSDYTEFLSRTLHTLAGWAGYAKYLSSRENGSRPTSGVCSMQEYLGVRVAILAACWPEAKQLLHHQVDASADVWDLRQIAAHEHAYRHQLMAQLLSTSAQEKQSNVQLQLVCCMDARSEPLRRILEKNPGVETYAGAGFFGLPIELVQAEAKQPRLACPPLVSPESTVHFSAKPSKQHLGSRISRIGRQLYQSLKNGSTSSLGLFELAGPIFTVWLSGCTWRSIQTAELKQWLLPQQEQELCWKTQKPSEKTLATWAAQFLRAIGLTKEFADSVLICGHASQTENNPQKSILDCGACGGQAGGTNAQLMSQILNDIHVRKALRNHKIAIPETTRFYPAEHQTTTGKLRLFTETPPPEIQHLLQDTEAQLVEETGLHIGLKRSPLERSTSWAETRPEWGLSRHASLIIGPRTFTKRLDLERRAFLHSYDWSQDPDGLILFGILSGPLRVAQWINSTYLFSALDPTLFGSGSKTTQNVTGKLGILQGNGSDLMQGLAIESISTTQNCFHHEPMRLQVVIVSPRRRLKQLILASSSLAKLVRNEWIHLACFDPSNEKMYRLANDLTWIISSF